MSLTFDLISDLHLETWPGNFDWSSQPTSAWCIVAGDVCRDLDLLGQTLQHLGKCYQGVFYIDGNDEHHGQYHDLNSNYQRIHRLLKSIDNVVYLQNNVVIVEETAILGTNGWWTFDFDQNLDPQQTMDWWCQAYDLSPDLPDMIRSTSVRDCRYLSRSLAKLQNEQVKNIVVVTHTVPYHKIISHDIELCHQPLFSVMGTDALIMASQQDVLDKIHTWCFGHYHGSVDQVHHGMRFVNNCRGRANSPYRKTVFHPLRIEVGD
jgi:predicted phosphohydrolase